MVVIAIGIMISVFTVFYQLSKTQQESYHNSFYKKYELKESNNPKIIFYNSELIKYSKDFMNSDDMYSNFKAYTKKEFASNCINYILKLSGVPFDAKFSYERNARNLSANTEDRIKKAKINEFFMRDNARTFDFKVVHNVLDDITEPYSKTKPSICTETKAVDKMYELFMPRYINNYISKYINDEKASQEDTWYAAFMANKQLKKNVNWINDLKLKYPVHFDNIDKANRIKEKAKALAEKNRIKEQNRIKEKIRIQKIEDDKSGYYQVVIPPKNN